MLARYEDIHICIYIYMDFDIIKHVIFFAVYLSLLL